MHINNIKYKIIHIYLIKLSIKLFIFCLLNKNFKIYNEYL